MSDMQEKAEAYVPLNTRLQTLKTRLDVPEYNEQQRLLFDNNCEELTKDVYKKVCRFITDCETPSTDLCLVAINYKETLPPSHPRGDLPINLLAELQTCCEPGRIACPELIMYSIEPENDVEDMMLYRKRNIGLGDLKLGIDFKNRTHCCESEDSWEEGLESIDFIEVLPSIQLDFSCEMGSIEFSREYYEEIELCYKRLEFLRKYHIWLDICKQDLSFEAIVEPVAEKCIACDTEYEVSAEASVENACGNLTVKVKKNITIDWCAPEFSEEFSIEISQECSPAETYVGRTEAEVFCLHGAYLKYKLKEKVTVDWCSGEVELKPQLEAECTCAPIQGPMSMFPVNVAIPGCTQDNELKIEGVGTLQSTLQPNGAISSKVTLGGMTAHGALGPGAGLSFVKNIIKLGSKLMIEYGYMRFTNGLFCGVQDGEVDIIDIGCDTTIDCSILRKRCKLCECSDSSSSSSSSSNSHSSSGSSGSDTPVSSTCWTIDIPPTSNVYDFKYDHAVIIDENGNIVDTRVVVNKVKEEDGYVYWEGFIPRCNDRLAYVGSELYFSTDTFTMGFAVTVSRGCDTVVEDSYSDDNGNNGEVSSSGTGNNGEVSSSGTGNNGEVSSSGTGECHATVYFNLSADQAAALQSLITVAVDIGEEKYYAVASVIGQNGTGYYRYSVAIDGPYAEADIRSIQSVDVFNDGSYTIHAQNVEVDNVWCN